MSVDHELMDWVGGVAGVVGSVTVTVNVSVFVEFRLSLTVRVTT